MEDIRALNCIDTQYRGLIGKIDSSFANLYSHVENETLIDVFSTLHALLVQLLSVMNERLPSGEIGSHFWAEPSRGMIEVIEKIRSLQRGLSHSKFAFELDPYYETMLTQCNTFLRRSGGSEIPPKMEPIELYYIIPIFIPSLMVKVPNNTNKNYPLKNIGEGSYALVYRYHDSFYDRDFVIKRAKKDLAPKELERFYREFEQMKTLNSPYIVEVYCYNKDANEYIMESMDSTLDKYIEENNSKLVVSDRKRLVNQIFKGIQYLHQKRLLHRDISPRNVLIRLYDDVEVVKIADFGLVKIPDSSLTSVATELKGSFNDPSLEIEGFHNYQIEHETYALTRLVYFIMTGKVNIYDMEEPLRSFVEKGLNQNKDLRYHSVEEMIEAFRKSTEYMK